MNRKNYIRAGWTALYGGSNHSVNPSRGSASRISFFHSVTAMNIEGISNLRANYFDANWSVTAMNIEGISNFPKKSGSIVRSVTAMNIEGISNGSGFLGRLLIV